MGIERESKREANPFHEQGIVHCVVEKSVLALLQQAGQNSGYSVEVTAEPGQQDTFWHQNMGKGDLFPTGLRTLVVGEGNLGIEIQRPADQKDHQAFWDEYHKLKAEQAQPK